MGVSLPASAWWWWWVPTAARGRLGGCPRVCPCPRVPGLTGPSLPAAGRAPGDLLIRSLSEVHTGVYQCRVTNRVGYSVCQLNLSPAPSKCRQPVGKGAAGGGPACQGATGGKVTSGQPVGRPAVTGCAPAPGGRQAGIIVGSILGSLLLLSLLGLLIGALICRYRRKECQRACSDCR